ncbi:MAG TPA: hypothetical protein PLV45_16670 [bacterium]|nr:hypothetical protein [bacterium]
MKTAGLHAESRVVQTGRTVRAVFLMLCICVTAVPGPAAASGLFSLEGDARAHWTEREDPAAELDVIAVSIRKTLADRTGDRWMLSAMLEFQDDLSEVMLHEAYVRFKGPMGKWNITTGRFQLPFGLLSSYSTNRQLYDGLTDATAGLHADGGILVSGVLGDLDYGLALTQGRGVHDDPDLHGLDLVSGRAGWTFGDFGDIAAGVSLLIGTSPAGHGPSGTHSNDFSGSETGEHSDTHENMPGDTRLDRWIVGLDATVYAGLWLTRWEFQTGEIGSDAFAGGFIMAEYPVLPRLDLTGSLRVTHIDRETTANLYLGFSHSSPWFTIRGGYTYDRFKTDYSHGVGIQLYRLVSWPF